MRKHYWLSIAFLCEALLPALPVRSQHADRRAFDSLRREIDPAKKDTIQLFSWLQMAEFHILKPGELLPDLDSARDCIDRAKILNAVLRSPAGEGYIALVESLLLREQSGGWPAAKKRNGQAVAILEQCRRPALLGRAYLELSWYEDYRDSEMASIKIGYLEKAVCCFADAKDLRLEGYCEERVADLYLNTGDFQQAEKYGKKAIERYRQVGNPAIQGACILVASACRRQLDYHSAMKYSLMALQALRDTRDSSRQICQINHSVGVLFGKMQEWPRAFPYFETALKWARSHRNLPDLYVVESSMVGGYVINNQANKAVQLVEVNEAEFGNPADSSAAIMHLTDGISAYSFAGRFDKAKIWLYKLSQMTPRRFPDRYFTAYSKMHFYFLSGQYGGASALMPEMRILMKSMPDSGLAATWYQWFFRIDTGLHRYQDAVADLLHYARLRDSVFDITKTRQIQRLELDYATAEKEHRIELLQKETELQKKDIIHSHQSRNIVVAGTALLLLAGFSRYRLKQRQNKQLEQRQMVITAKNIEMKKLLQENEWLLREVHHRVKNNLQMVMSLLGTQSARLQDTAAYNAVQESQHRVQSMALIHQKLYKGSNVSAVDMEDYIGDLVAYLRDSINPRQAIVFDVRVRPVLLDVAQAVPLGLILNEIITNSIKYAFPGDRSGLIRVELFPQEDGLICLHASDNGIGLPDELDPYCCQGFGMRLIRGLAEDLDAGIEVGRTEGTGWFFSFRMHSI